MRSICSAVCLRKRCFIQLCVVFAAFALDGGQLRSSLTNWFWCMEIAFRRNSLRYFDLLSMHISAWYTTNHLWRHPFFLLSSTTLLCHLQVLGRYVPRTVTWTVLVWANRVEVWLPIVIANLALANRAGEMRANRINWQSYLQSQVINQDHYNAIMVLETAPLRRKNSSWNTTDMNARVRFSIRLLM